MCKILFLLVLGVVLSIGYVSGHGMVLNPVGRSSRWRYDRTAPPNWNDNELFCGGFGVQWSSNGGRCGYCGNNFRDPKPRSNEHGGTFGQGVIVANYRTGGQLPVSVMITTNHRGSFFFNICNMDRSVESDECYALNPLKLVGGADRFTLPSWDNGWYNMTLQLPPNLSCNHCVLQWVYIVANTWGICPDGTGAAGCGPQEQFRSCSDISITNTGRTTGSYYNNIITYPVLDDNMKYDENPEIEINDLDLTLN